MPRETWKGFLRLSLAFWSVQLSPATTPTKRINRQKSHRLGGTDGLPGERSDIIDVEGFVSRDDVDPVFLDTPYYIKPDGELAAQGLAAVGATMAAKKLVGLGWIVERRVIVEPHAGGLLLTTLRSASEICAPEPRAAARGELDTEMLAAAETIVERRRDYFGRLRERYQEALR